MSNEQKFGEYPKLGPRSCRCTLVNNKIMNTCTFRAAGQGRRAQLLDWYQTCFAISYVVRSSTRMLARCSASN